MTDLGLPRSSEELTPVWLDSALRAAGVIDSATVTSVRLESLEGGTGASVTRVKLDYDRDEPGAPATLIAKLPSPAGIAARHIMTKLGMYVREARFYDELAGLVDIRTPRCYFNALDDSTQTGVLLLEDLTVGRLGQSGITFDDAVLVLDRLARFHAGMWDHPGLREMDWLDWGDRSDSYLFLTRAWWSEILRDSSHAIDEGALGIIEAAIANTPRAMSLLSQPPLTLVHGDLWPPNLAFDDGADDPVTAFDWQLVARMRPGFDVGYFLDVTSDFSNIKDTEEWFEETGELILGYHDALIAQGAGGYSVALLQRDRRLSYVYTLTADVWSQAHLKGLLGSAYEEGLRQWSSKVAERTARLGLTEHLERDLRDL